MGLDDDAHRVSRATAAARSVVVVFELMADGDDDDVARAFDLEQRDVAQMSEGDDQLAQERALRGLSAGERRCLQGREARPDRCQRPFGQFQVAAVVL